MRLWCNLLCSKCDQQLQIFFIFFPQHSDLCRSFQLPITRLCTPMSGFCFVLPLWFTVCIFNWLVKGVVLVVVGDEAGNVRTQSSIPQHLLCSEQLGLKTDKYILWRENNTPSSEASTGSKIFWIFHSDNVPQFLASRHSLRAASAVDWKSCGLSLSSLSQLWLGTESQRPELVSSEVTTLDSIYYKQCV